MKAAIVGAGLAGLAVAYHLGRQGGWESTLFDPKGIGGGASGVSTGLLHPFPGKRALRSWGAEEGMRETSQLIHVSERALGRPVAEKTGIFRPAVTEQQKADFSSRADEDPEAIWQEHPQFGPGLWIPQGVTLYSRLYLEGLWKACQGATLVKESVGALADLQHYDAIVLTAGFETLHFAPHLPLQITKGQTLLCRWPERLPFSLVSQGHITPTEDPTICQVGSTYEHTYASLDPDPKATEELLAKVESFYPPAGQFEVLEIRSGARISRPKGYRPIAEKTAPKTWLFTGLGSRGMLYHAWMGKKIAQEINQFSLELNSRSGKK